MQIYKKYILGGGGSIYFFKRLKKICLLKYAQNKAVVRLLQLFYKFNRPGLIFKMNVFIMWSVKCDFKKLSDTRSLQSLQTLGSWS